MSAKYIFIYDEDFGVAFPDGKVVEEVTRMLSEKTTSCFLVSNASVIEEVRLRIVRGELDHKLVSFRFNSFFLSVNEFGDMSEWPKGFCSINFDRMWQLGILATRKRYDSTQT